MPLPVSLPTRVSRLYPVFALIFLLSSSIFYFAWQQSQIELERLSTFEQREQGLRDQIDKLTADNRLDQAKIQVQNQKITEATEQLNQVQQQLKTQTDQLASTTESLKKAQEQLKSQQDQLASNAAEITQLRSRPPLFSFQNKSTTLSDVVQKQADVKQTVSTAYEYIQEVYGQPYLLSSITITFVDSFSIAESSGEIVITNGPNGIKMDIHLKDFNKTDFQDVNTLIHEMIHGFHGTAVFDTTAFEEGMTVAATDAVMERMIADRKLPNYSRLYLSWSDQQYANWNETLKVRSDNTAFYADPDVAKVYQLIGSAWFKLYAEDPSVFKKINEAYYPKVQRGLKPDAGMARDAIRASIKSVKGQSIDAFLASNAAFNPN